MSFNFSLHNEDDENGDIELNLEGFDDTGLLALASREREYETSAADPDNFAANARAVPTSNNVYNETDILWHDGDNDDIADDEGDWCDDVDWQDDDDENDGGRELPETSSRGQSPVEICIRRRVPSRGVTIDFGSLTDEEGSDDKDRKTTKKRKRAPTRKVLRNIPVETQLLIRDIRRVQLLCFLAVGARCSYTCGNNVTDSLQSQERGSNEGEYIRNLLSHIAFSLVPMEFHDGEMQIEQSDLTKGRPDAETVGNIIPTSSKMNMRKQQQSSTHHSMPENPGAAPRKKPYTIPSKPILLQFSQWFFKFVNRASDRRREIINRNISMGAAIIPNNNITNSSSKSWSPRRTRRQRRKSDFKTAEIKSEMHSENSHLHPSSSNERQRGTFIPPTKCLLQRLMHLSPHFDEDPQLFLDRGGVIENIDFTDVSNSFVNSDAVSAVANIPALEKVLLFLSFVRSIGWRARFVTALNPLPLELTVDHPLLESSSTSSKKDSSIRRHQNSSDSDQKPPARLSWKDHGKLLKQTIQYMQEGGVLNNKAKTKDHIAPKLSSDAFRNTSSKASAFSIVASDDAIDSLSSSDDHGDSQRGREIGANSARMKTQKQQTLQCSGESSNSTLRDNVLSWVEVLCFVDGTKESSNKRIARWIPIHPEYELVDRPESVESILAWLENHEIDENRNQSRNHYRHMRQNRGKSSRVRLSSKTSFRQSPPDYPKKTPVSYVLAVEHNANSVGPPSDGGIEANHLFLHGVRFTDVTPRYSNAWSRTLRLRGATAKDVVKGGGKCIDEWWSKCLTELNRQFKFKSPSLKRDKGVNDSSATKSLLALPPMHVTKSINERGDEVEIVEICLSEDETNNAKFKHESHDSDEDHDKEELKELKGARSSEKIPTSKEAFKKSPFYVIPSVLNMNDVLHPDASKRVCGVFKGELVYKRSDVVKALRSKKWLYEGRKVKESELGKPVKMVKARKKPSSKGFKALETYGISEDAQEEMLRSIKTDERDDGDNEMDSLYGIWQTVPWTPRYVGPNDPIPTNEHKNIELALLNPGLIHIELPQISKIARKLGVPYAPCMLGFEGHGGNRAPTIRGIVVHKHNETLLREAYIEFESHLVEMESEARRKAILKRWKRLVVGVLTKDRLDREYG